VVDSKQQTKERPEVQRTGGGGGGLSSGVKWPGVLSVANLSVAEINSEWTYTSTSHTPEWRGRAQPDRPLRLPSW